MAKNHSLTICVIAFAVGASASESSLPHLRTVLLPDPTAVELYLAKSKLPARLKDVLSNQVSHAKYYASTMDLKLKESSSDSDWHMDDKGRVLAHVDRNGRGITLYPEFFKRAESERVRLLLHLSLHTMVSLGPARFSEKLIQELLQEMDVNDPVRLSDWIDKNAEPYRALVPKPWPFDGK